MLRSVLVLLVLGLLAACGSGKADLDKPPVALGDFKLGHNVAVAPKVKKGPFSRSASEDELTEAMRSAISERFDRYNGDKLYHFGISLEGYVLAAPGIPLVASPKSVLIVYVTVWDDAAGKKLNEEPHQITVLETFGTGTVVGSGYTLNKDEQLEQLAQNAAKQVERYLVRQQKEQGWFQPAAPNVVEDTPDPEVSLNGTVPAQAG
ncbi:MAG: hypothetical protein ABJM43_00720 [Paracoccaceae bacterium]